jgi:hypothetical protein
MAHNEPIAVDVAVLDRVVRRLIDELGYTRQPDGIDILDKEQFEIWCRFIREDYRADLWLIERARNVREKMSGDTSKKREGLPEVGEATACGEAGCPAPHFEQGFGLAGGGYGPYEYCGVCGKLVSKTEARDG